MKSQMLEMGIVAKCVEHLRRNAPPITSVLVKADDPFWKEFVSKASLRYILRTLAGLAVDHEPTQLLVCEHCIPILHQTEQGCIKIGLRGKIILIKRKGLGEVLFS